MNGRNTIPKKISREIEITIDETKRFWKDFQNAVQAMHRWLEKTSDVTRAKQRQRRDASREKNGTRNKESFHRTAQGNECIGVRMTT